MLNHLLAGRGALDTALRSVGAGEKNDQLERRLSLLRYVSISRIRHVRPTSVWTGVSGRGEWLSI